MNLTEEETERMTKRWRQKTLRSIEILNRLKEKDKMNSLESIIPNLAEKGARKAYGDRKPLTEILERLDEFYPKFKVTIDCLGRYDTDHLDVITICRKALRRKYEIVFDPINKEISIGKQIKKETR